MKKIIVSFILGGIIFGSIGVYAVGHYNASEIDYNNTKVDAALNDLYNNTISLEYLIGMKWEFDYSGKEEQFTLPFYGKYKLETWGAQGGTSNGNANYGGVVNDTIGGYGGYSVGEVQLSRNDKLYINVGGAGQSNCKAAGSSSSAWSTCTGGYNGGGNGVSKDPYAFVSSGGGATHIGTSQGLLSSLENNKNDILIVAAGGGGSFYYNYNSMNARGFAGSAGGYIGNKGTNNKNSSIEVNGGTQDTGAEFGKGGNTSNQGSGSGGGYYGGLEATWGIYNNIWIGNGGAGGSSYIGNSKLTSKSMYCYNCTESNEELTKTISTTCTSNEAIENCSKQGNGYVRITYLGK